MKIILAPDSFKESLSAVQVCQAMQRGIQEVLPDAVTSHLPLADGGEGTVETLVAATQGSIIECDVIGPLGDAVKAAFGILGDQKTAIIEMAAASGLPLVPPAKRNPLLTTTYGTGQLIQAALEQNVKHIILGIGGSATNDCGAGMAQALGVLFFSNLSPITDYMTGSRLGAVDDIDLLQLDDRLRDVHITVACDVDNPLLGERGAARVYSPQKGATPEIVFQLEQHSAFFITLVEQKTRPVRDIPGAGAAGGLGAGLMAFLNAELKSGIDTILDACRFDERIKDADLILTGEGRIDSQTAMGKTISGVLERAQKCRVPVVALAGTISDDANVLYEKGLQCMFSICDRPMPLKDAFANASHLVQKTSNNIMRLLYSS